MDYSKTLANLPVADSAMELAGRLIGGDYPDMISDERINAAAALIEAYAAEREAAVRDETQLMMRNAREAELVAEKAELQAKCEALVADNNRLGKFVLQVLRTESWYNEGCLDGGELQDLAETLGLVEFRLITQDDHENGDFTDFDIGDPICVPSPTLAQYSKSEV